MKKMQLSSELSNQRYSKQSVKANKAFRVLFIMLITILGNVVVVSCFSQNRNPTPSTLATATETEVNPTPAVEILTGTPDTTPTTLPTLEPELGPTWIRPMDGMVMVYVPAGEFLMGSETGEAIEKPEHTVDLDAFWIDQTEITNSLYVKCVDAGKCDDPGANKHSVAKVYPNYPVSVNWEMANAYCEWVGGRLPTEAEWEKAARGGLEGKKYPWGDEQPTCQADAISGANWELCPGSGSVQVMTFAPNGFGLYDMAGNMWEWVADWYASDYYLLRPSTNPQGPETGNAKALRGGSWYDPIYNLRVSVRDWDIPTKADSDYGFRCARSAIP